MIHIETKLRQALEQIAEVKRILCAIEFALQKQECATLLITSAVQGEGKSLIAAALAATAAQHGNYRVAALDFNWYRPALHRCFDRALPHSLKALYSAPLSELVISFGPNTPDLLTAPEDYADQSALTDQAFPTITRLIGQARKSYNLIVIDSAAVFPTNRMMIDPVMLSGIATGVVMVVLSAVTPKQHVRKAQKIMEAAGANMLGVVTNQRMISGRK
jgi:Mrp family chromosome partitioning ATPase